MMCCVNHIEGEIVKNVEYISTKFTVEFVEIELWVAFGR